MTGRGRVHRSPMSWADDAFRPTAAGSAPLAGERTVDDVADAVPLVLGVVLVSCLLGPLLLPGGGFALGLLVSAVVGGGIVHAKAPTSWWGGLLATDAVVVLLVLLST